MGASGGCRRGMPLHRILGVLLLMHHDDCGASILLNPVHCSAMKCVDESNTPTCILNEPEKLEKILLFILMYFFFLLQLTRS